MTDDWTAEDFEALLSCGALSDDTDDPLKQLGRRIAGQYVDVLIPFAQEVFRGPPGRAAVAALTEAMTALHRLVSATGDDAFARHLDQMPALIERASVSHPSQRSGFLRDMRTWILRVAEMLDPQDSEHLRQHFDAEAGDAPLLEHLRSVPGVGKQRLQRLYCAGLYTPNALSEAEAGDVAVVTGIPMEIAERCIEASRAFTRLRRQQVVERLSSDVRHVLLLLSEAPDPAFASSIREVLSDLVAALEATEQAPGSLDPAQELLPGLSAAFPPDFLQPRER